jgi:hypothetical protein
LPCPPDHVTDCVAGSGVFRWLHLNLTDTWTLDWIRRSPALPGSSAAVYAVLRMLGLVHRS